MVGRNFLLVLIVFLIFLVNGSLGGDPGIIFGLKWTDMFYYYSIENE